MEIMIIIFAVFLQWYASYLYIFLGKILFIKFEQDYSKSSLYTSLLGILTVVVSFFLGLLSIEHLAGYCRISGGIECGSWGWASPIFFVISPLLTLSSNSYIKSYVSKYQFYSIYQNKSFLFITLIILLLTFLFSSTYIL